VARVLETEREQVKDCGSQGESVAKGKEKRERALMSVQQASSRLDKGGQIELG
jgi:hypothetical protein